MNPLAAIVAIAGVVLLALGVSYNRFASQRQYLANAWANIDTELRRRYDLIPNLVATVKGYAAHERGVLEAVVVARSAAVASTGPIGAQATDEQALVGTVRQLLAVAEGYPDLKANQQFLELQAQLVTTEDRIQAARRLYNNNVREYNRRVASVPSALVAKWFNFAPADYFEVDPAVRTAPDARLPD